MALMFTRLARNFIKNGYFPTDDATLTLVLSALQCSTGHVRIWDPCCGEGTALAEVKSHLQALGAQVTALGVEFDAERAWHAKRLLDRAIHSDINDVVVSPRSTSLLFLNPPYGLGVADKAALGDGQGTERLEMAFLRRTTPTLVTGGVLVLIVPHYAIDKAMATYLARNFESIEVSMAPEQRFKQCVILGIKSKPAVPAKGVLAKLEAARAGELPLPDGPGAVWPGDSYVIPSIPVEGEWRFNAVRIDPAQLRDELDRMRGSTLWRGFNAFFKADTDEHRRPARSMGSWHLALALAAGQISGRVESKDGRLLLIKGDTFKRKERTSTFETDEDGEVATTVTLTDKFVPVINAIEFTPGPNFGRVLTIR